MGDILDRIHNYTRDFIKTVQYFKTTDIEVSKVLYKEVYFVIVTPMINKKYKKHFENGFRKKFEKYTINIDIASHYHGNTENMLISFELKSNKDLRNDKIKEFLND